MDRAQHTLIRRTARGHAALLAALLLCACTAQQLYGSRQAWQRNECKKLPDKADYDRCMESTATDYESYKRQTEALRK